MDPVIDATTVNNVIYTGDDLSTTLPQTNPFTPSNTQWETKTIDLSNYIGTSYIRFAFESTPDINSANIIYIDNVHFYENSPLSISTQIKQNFHIFPNPTTSLVTIITDIKPLTHKNIKIYNLLGQEYSNFEIHKQNDSYEIQLENFSEGVYYISLHYKNKIVT